MEDKKVLMSWKKAIENITPVLRLEVEELVEQHSKFQLQLEKDRKASLAMKWLIRFARKRNEKTMAQKLAAEIIAASKEEGAAFKKKEDTLRMAEANKAFSHILDFNRNGKRS